MKQTLLLTFLAVLFTFTLNAQTGDCANCGTGNYENQSYNVTEGHANAPKRKITIFPNPAIDFIGLSDKTGVKEILVFNVVGRKMLSFKVDKNSKYNVSSLPKGVYLVQIIDHGGKTITTQRLNKR